MTGRKLPSAYDALDPLGTTELIVNEMDKLVRKRMERQEQMLQQAFLLGYAIGKDSLSDGDRRGNRRARTENRDEDTSERRASPTAAELAAEAGQIRGNVAEREWTGEQPAGGCDCSDGDA